MTELDDKQERILAAIRAGKSAEVKRLREEREKLRKRYEIVSREEHVHQTQKWNQIDTLFASAPQDCLPLLDEEFESLLKSLPLEAARHAKLYNKRQIEWSTSWLVGFGVKAAQSYYACLVRVGSVTDAKRVRQRYFDVVDRLPMAAAEICMAKGDLYVMGYSGVTEGYLEEYYKAFHLATDVEKKAAILESIGSRLRSPPVSFESSSGDWKPLLEAIGSLGDAGKALAAKYYRSGNWKQAETLFRYDPLPSLPFLEEEFELLLKSLPVEAVGHAKFVKKSQSEWSSRYEIKAAQFYYASLLRVGRAADAERVRQRYGRMIDQLHMSLADKFLAKGDLYDMRYTDLSQNYLVNYYEAFGAAAETKTKLEILDRIGSYLRLKSSTLSVPNTQDWERLMAAIHSLGDEGKALSVKVDAFMQLNLARWLALNKGDMRELAKLQLPKLIIDLEGRPGEKPTTRDMLAKARNLGMQAVYYSLMEDWEMVLKSGNDALGILRALPASESEYNYALTCFQFAGLLASRGEHKANAQHYFNEACAAFAHVRANLDLRRQSSIHTLAASTALQLGEYEVAANHAVEALKADPKDRFSAVFLSSFRLAGRNVELAKMRREMLADFRDTYPDIIRYRSELERAEDLTRSVFLERMLNSGGDETSAEAVMMLKGLAGDIQTALLASKMLDRYEKQDLTWKARWHECRAKLAELTLKSSKSTSPEELGERETLGRELAGMEAIMGDQKDLHAVLETLQWNPTRWMANIPADSVAVNVIRYSKGTDYDGGGLKLPVAWYGAAVLGNGIRPQFVELGSASEVEKAVAEFRTLVIEDDPSADMKLKKLCRQLYGMVAEPLEKIIPTGATICYSPDAALNLFPLAACLSENGELWSAQRKLRQVASFRRSVTAEDRSASSSATQKQALLVGGVDYESVPVKPLTTADIATTRGSLAGTNIATSVSSLPSDVAFSPLPGTGAEVVMLQDIFKKHGWRTTTLTGSKPSEKALLANGGCIIHLATHGFFFGSNDTLSKGTHQARHTDPMAMTGIALAGAQRTLTAWQAGIVPPLDSDGMLLASEVAGMDLRYVDLLVLSACETGLGTVTPGEAVAGFTKACAQAGVKQTLVTLWPIEDEATVAIMAEFYRQLLSGITADDALRQAQSNAFAQRRETSGLRAALHQAMPFVLVGSR